MGCWSALDAMEAYVHTLQLCKDYNYNQGRSIEPGCIKFISALAAGSHARLMVSVISHVDGCPSPATLALPIAARHMGGRLLCICHNQEALRPTRVQIEELELGDAVTFKVGDPREEIKRCKDIDFSVVDRRVGDCDGVLFAMDVNPNGSVVVLSNLLHGIRRKERVSSLVHHPTRGRGAGVKSGILPIGGGMEVTRIGEGCRRGS